jgi:hypothetical protein
MQCKICERERQVRKYFKTDTKNRICDGCLDDMGYGKSIANEVYSSIESDIISKLNEKVERAVNRELPKLIEKLLVESGMEFELTVK